MRTWNLSVLTLLGLGSCLVTAFPSEENPHKMMGASGHNGKRCPFATDQDQVPDELHKRANSGSPIDVTGKHAFQPPDFEKGDVRGLCPGLNALANHGYIPHSGIVSIAEMVSAANQVYGMGVDLATVLSTTSAIWVGNPISLNPSFSIGGPSPKLSNLLGNLGGLLGEPQGLNGAHNFLETDASNTRDDLYVTGDNFRLNMDKYKEWEELSPDGIFSMDLMAKRAKIRFDQSTQTNPYFYSGPFTGLVARNAAYLVGTRLFANYSEEHPEGVYTRDNMRSFHAIYEEGGELTYREGWERIPENLYPTPVEWGLARLNLDLVDWSMQYPELANIGGNTGTVNSFAGIDLADLTGGTVNLSTLLKDNNLLCFIFQFLKFASPNALAGLYKLTAVPLNMLTDAIAAPLLDLACPAFDDLQLKMDGKSFWDAAQAKFPGAKKSGSAL